MQKIATNARMRILFVHSWLILLYAATRFWRLTDSCLWFDEIFSVHAAEHPWGEILNFVALDLIHPPLFYVLLKLWIAAGGESLFWLRLFPVVFSLIAVFPFLRLCDELKIGKWTRVLALFLIAVNGSLIKYSQEVRMYAPLMCLSLFSMWLFARYFVKGKSFVPLLIVNVLMVYTHYFGWFVVVTEVALILWFQRIKWRRVAVMFGVVFAAFLPWLIAVVSAARGGSDLGQNIGWMERPGIRELAIFVVNVVEPFYFQTSSAEPRSQVLVSIPLLIVLVIAASIFLPGWKHLDSERRTRLWFLLALIKLPVVAALVASWLLPHSIWGTRHLITVLAPFWIYAALMFSGIKDRRLAGGIVTFVLVWSTVGFINAARLPTPDRPWCACTDLLGQIPETDTANVYVYTDLDAYQSWFAVRRERRVFKIELLEGGGDPAFFLPRGFDAVERTTEGAIAEKRFWILFSESSQEPVSREKALEREGFRVVRVAEYQGRSGPTVLALIERP